MISDSKFDLVSSYEPSGDQPKAIKALVENYNDGVDKQVLLGVTGSGKTFTMANVIQQLNVPTIVIAHNKTLAAQLYGEFKKFFPNNAVEYFVSYYDYYQPEAYVPSADKYIEKDATVNEEIEKLRHSATRSLMERKDVIIISSVSCIYGLGSPESYSDQIITFTVGDAIDFDTVTEKLVFTRYNRGDYEFERGCFRVKGDVIEIFPSYEDSVAYRIEFFGDEVEKIFRVNPLLGEVLEEVETVSIYPNTHYVAPDISLDIAIAQIKEELLKTCAIFHESGKIVEEQRLSQRTMYDIEMIRETGYTKGIENYSRIFEGRGIGTPPSTLLSYFPKDALTIIDESHMTLPQIRGMSSGDRSRKMKLVEYGFRLPCALDNRPLTFDEFNERTNRTLYVSATPAEYELDRSEGVVVEQLIRPTGLIDPPIEIRPSRTQVDDLLAEIQKVKKDGGRVLVTSLTKKSAEKITDYFSEVGIQVKYMHSDVDTLDRIRIIRELRQGSIDVLVGVNLLREGLDIPEVELVAILDADKEGFLRSERSLVQTVGRAARNLDARAIFYADSITNSMEQAMKETERRRNKQIAYNKEHNITPTTVRNDIVNILESIYEKDYMTIELENPDYEPTGTVKGDIKKLEKLMYEAAKQRDYEKAAKYRDIILELKAK